MSLSLKTQVSITRVTLSYAAIYTASTFSHYVVAAIRFKRRVLVDQRFIEVWEYQQIVCEKLQ